MLTSGQQERKSKQRKIRNSEYYDMEGTFDRLYAESKKDKTFNHLMEIIESEENIKLAYRTIKKNTGSDTSGVDKRTIADLAKKCRCCKQTLFYPVFSICSLLLFHFFQIHHRLLFPPSVFLPCRATHFSFSF